MSPRRLREVHQQLEQDKKVGEIAAPVITFGIEGKNHNSYDISVMAPCPGTGHSGSARRGANTSNSNTATLQ